MLKCLRRDLVQKNCESFECWLIECFKENTHEYSVGGKRNTNLLE